MAQDTTPVQPEVPSGISEEAAAAEILKRMGVSDEPPAEMQSEEETPTEEADEATAEEEETTEEQPEESEEVEIDVAGEKFKVPAALKEQAERIQAKAKEVEAGATRKFQEAADARKFAETQIEQAKQISQVSEQELQLLTNQRTVAARLQQIMSIDVAALAETDPATLTRLNAEAIQLQSAHQQIEAALKQTQAQKQEKLTQAEQGRLAHLQDWAKKNIKGFDDAHGDTLLQFSVKELGADPVALRQMLSEPVLKALDLAYKGWKVSQTDPKAKQVPASTKTLKPGATGQQKSSVQQNADTAMRRLAQTKNVNDAAAAILARANAKKRR